MCDQQEMKTCSKCGVEKPDTRENFLWDDRYQRTRAECRACKHAYDAARYARHVQDPQWLQAHRAEAIARYRAMTPGQKAKRIDSKRRRYREQHGLPGGPDV